MMRKKSKFILLSILIAVIIFVLWIVRPPSSYDKSKVDGRLTSLEEPFKDVSAGYYQDGGSISIKIVDKNDTLLKVALPVIDFDESYTEIYFGISHLSELKDKNDGAKAENPTETKLMLVDILDRYPNGNPSIDIALCSLRGRVKDYIKFIYHTKMGNYPRIVEKQRQVPERQDSPDRINK